MAPRPEATSSQVPGSGTVPPPPPPAGAQGYRLPLVVVVTAVPFGFFPMPHTSGSEGGEMGTQVPLEKGSYKFKGRAGPIAGAGLSKADSKGSGGFSSAVPRAGIMGSSNFAAGGSKEEFAC